MSYGEWLDRETARLAAKLAPPTVTANEIPPPHFVEAQTEDDFSQLEDCYGALRYNTSEYCSGTPYTGPWPIGAIVYLDKALNPHSPEYGPRIGCPARILGYMNPLATDEEFYAQVQWSNCPERCNQGHYQVKVDRLTATKPA